MTDKKGDLVPLDELLEQMDDAQRERVRAVAQTILDGTAPGSAFTNPIKTITMAPSDQVEAIQPFVDKVLEALGVPEAMITNESEMGHFRDDEDEDDAGRVAQKLGAEFSWDDTVVEVAMRLMEEAS